MARSRKDKDAATAADEETTTSDATKRDPSSDIEDAEVIEEISADGTSSEEQGAEHEDRAVEVEATSSDQAENAEPEPADDPEATGDPSAETEDVADPETTAEETDTEASQEPENAEAQDSESGTEDGTTAEEPEPAAAAQPTERELNLVPFFVAAVGGGIVAALLGFVAARQLDTTEAPEGPTPAENASAVAALDSRLGSIDSALADVAARDMQAVADATVSPVTEALSDTNARIGAVSEQLAALSERVETIAMRPTATGIEADEFDAALGEFREQLNAAISNAQIEIEAARAEAARISDEAYSAEQAALARAAWGQVTTALQSGAAYSEPLATLSELDDAEIPDALAASAQDGIPTLASLQQAFPDAAREALDAAIRAETGDAPLDRLTSFLRVQSGVRSLSPRDGDDPDAILSRVEAALRDGDLPAALAELKTLDGPGRDALAAWEATARARIAAIEAATAVSGQLNSN